MTILGRVSKLTRGPVITDFSEHKTLCVPGSQYAMQGCRPLR